jgi:hypothetical protein
MEITPARTRRPKFFQRNYLIYPRPQLSIVGYLLVIFWMAMATLYLGVTQTISAIDMEGLRISAAQADLLTQLHQARLSSLNEFFAGFTLISTFVMVAGGIFLSHRVVGPIYRIRMILEQWSRGEKPYPLKCRGEDFFQELFPLIEKLVIKDFDEHPNR